MKNELPHLLKPQSDLARASHHLGVVLAVADASPRLGQCLAALSAALAKAVEYGHRAELFVVIDGRNADSAAIASNYAVHLVTAEFSDLARARAIGARAALSSGASWLAFTECSALVADSWLIEQISTESELLLGNVEITNGFMAEEFRDEGSRWHDLDAHASEHQALQLSANFSNLGMSRSAFELACHLGGQELRLDAALLDQLATLQIATHRCSKPLVYARMQGLEQILLGGDAPLRRAPMTGGSHPGAQSANTMAQAAAHCAPALLSLS